MVRRSGQQEAIIGFIWRPFRSLSLCYNFHSGVVGHASVHYLFSHPSFSPQLKLEPSPSEASTKVIVLSVWATNGSCHSSIIIWFPRNQKCFIIPYTTASQRSQPSSPRAVLTGQWMASHWILIERAAMSGVCLLQRSAAPDIFALYKHLHVVCSGWGNLYPLYIKLKESL